MLLENFGCQVFSPLHKVGTAGSNVEIATEDLEGLRNCKTILALINDGDTGTIFELGYGKANNKRAVVYAERNTGRDLTMLDGTSCMIFPDYGSAIYNAIWESIKQ
jgi:nucleoside 2-deoxyribosyltransferase